jgi:hypothetical protein
MTTKGKVSTKRFRSMRISTQLSKEIANSKVMFKSGKRVSVVKGSRRGSRRS